MKLIRPLFVMVVTASLSATLGAAPASATSRRAIDVVLTVTPGTVVHALDTVQVSGAFCPLGNTVTNVGYMLRNLSGFPLGLWGVDLSQINLVQTTEGLSAAITVSTTGFLEYSLDCSDGTVAVVPTIAAYPPVGVLGVGFNPVPGMGSLNQATVGDTVNVTIVSIDCSIGGLAGASLTASGAGTPSVSGSGVADAVGATISLAIAATTPVGDYMLDVWCPAANGDLHQQVLVHLVAPASTPTSDPSATNEQLPKTGLDRWSVDVAVAVSLIVAGLAMMVISRRPGQRPGSGSGAGRGSHWRQPQGAP